MIFNANFNYIRKVGNQAFISITFNAEKDTVVPLQTGQRIVILEDIPTEIIPKSNIVLTSIFTETNNGNVINSIIYQCYLRASDRQLVLCTGQQYKNLTNNTTNRRNDELQITGSYFIK